MIDVSVRPLEAPMARPMVLAGGTMTSVPVVATGPDGALWVSEYDAGVPADQEGSGLRR